VSPISLYFLVLIGVALPLLSIRSYFKLKAGAPLPPKSRLRAQTLLMELIFLALSLVVWRDTGMVLFPRTIPGARDWAMGGAVLAAFVGFMLPVWKNAAVKRHEKTYRRMPASQAEMPLWCVMALTAGIVEEIVYRGVLFGILMWWLHNWWMAAVLCAVSFALGHSIQGWKMVLIIFAMSLIFQGLVRMTGSLYVAMAVHAMYDAIAGLMYVRFYRLGVPSSAASAAQA
jgi:membrane protease YdiL (CAAX protease family)